MIDIVLDFETFWIQGEYSLAKKGTTIESYVRDPRFEVILLSVEIPSEGERYWVANYKDAVAKELDKLELHKHRAIAHNMPFDGFILGDHYGIECGEYGCTLSMARPLHGVRDSNSLANLAARYKLANKGDAVTQASGKRLKDFSRSEIEAYGNYGMRDDELCWELFKIFRPKYSLQDMAIISDTMRASCAPQFEIDVPLLQAYLPKLEAMHGERVLKLANMLDLSLDSMKHTLSSNEMFAETLRMFGIDPPTKISLKTKKEGYAFAQNDLGFKALLEDENDDVVLLCQARLGTTSTIGRTRAERFIGIGSRGKMPFPLKPFATGTGRWAATEKINGQNLPKRKGDITMRQSMKAPKGYSVITCDLAQIEARRMADHAGQKNLVEQFKHNLDPYSLFATKIYGYPVSKQNGKKTERNVGKEGILSLQYGAGYESWWLRLRSAYDIKLEKAFCKSAVYTYRSEMKGITDFWKDCNQAIDVMRHGGSFIFGANQDYYATKGGIYLPDDWFIKYDDIAPARDADGRELADDFGRPIIQYTDRINRSRKKIYQGIVANNVTQGSSARILMWQIARLREEGIFMAGTVHDELIFIVPNEELYDWAERIEYWMKRGPDWAAGTPIDCELEVGPNYGDQFDIDLWHQAGFNLDEAIRLRKLT